MLHETYWASATQLLPLVALAALVEVRWLHRRHARLLKLQRDERIALTRSERWFNRVMSVYFRLVAAGVVVTMATASASLGILRSGEDSGWVASVITVLLPSMVAVASAPVIVIFSSRTADWAEPFD